MRCEKPAMEKKEFLDNRFERYHAAYLRRRHPVQTALRPCLALAVQGIIAALVLAVIWALR